MYVSEDGVPMEKKYAQEESDPLYPIYTFVDADLSGTAESGKADQLFLCRLSSESHHLVCIHAIQISLFRAEMFHD